MSTFLSSAQALSQEITSLVHLPEPFDSLFPNGIIPGSSVLIKGETGGASSIALSILAKMSAKGNWCCVVSMPWITLEVAYTMGANLENIAVLDCIPTKIPQVISHILPATSLVLIDAEYLFSMKNLKLLLSKARNTTTIIIASINPIKAFSCNLNSADFSRNSSFMPDYSITAVKSYWDSLNRSKRVLNRHVTIESGGRRTHGLRIRKDFLLPSETGEAVLLRDQGLVEL